MARLRILESTLKRLFALTGNRCAFPDCPHDVVNQHGDLIAEVCHIEAANSDGGQRFNPDQEDEERRAFDNLIVLCPTHHTTTDNVDEYPVERLQKMKREHEESWQSQPPQIPPDQIDRLIGQLTGIAVSKLPAGATRTKLIGRSTELRKLTNALQGDTHVLSLVAWGGTGKSALTAHWMVRLAKRNWGDIERYFDWSFYSQGTKGEQGTSADLFIASANQWLFVANAFSADRRRRSDERPTTNTPCVRCGSSAIRTRRPAPRTTAATASPDSRPNSRRC